MSRNLVEAAANNVLLAQTKFEIEVDLLFGVIFLVITAVSGKRMLWSRSQQGPGSNETTVVTAFYTLIFITGFLRALWFLIPKSWVQPAYAPTAVMAFTDEKWAGVLFSQLLVTFGSLTLFFIFILILVYWADILKKYFYPGARRSKPMHTFLKFVVLLVFVEGINYFCFLMGFYSSEGVVLFNSILLGVVSIVCVAEISIFSHRFRTVLKTLGAINQVSTESQVKRIVWITVTGNLFFVFRALVEAIFASTLLYYYHQNGNVSKIFSHKYWDTYLLARHCCEVVILCLMLYILQSKFTTQQQKQGADGGYEPVPDSADQATVTVNSTNVIV